MSETIEARDVETGRTREFTDKGELHGMLAAGQVIPLREDGSAARVQQLLDGYLIDGVPINVLMDGTWEAGQRDLMEIYWDSGRVPRPETVPGEPAAAAGDPPAGPEPAPDTPATFDQGTLIRWALAAGAAGYLLGRRYL